MIHIDATDSDIDKVEGKGALNFLAIDDLSIAKEGELIAADSIVEMDFMTTSLFFQKSNTPATISFSSRSTVRRRSGQC